MKIQNIPKSLQSDGLFCVWKYIDRDGERTKCPFNPLTGAPAASNDHSTFCSFAQAKQAMGNGDYDGLGVGVFGSVGVLDLDDCVDASGKLSEQAREIISVMQSYTEISPSGAGVHIWFLADGFNYDKAKYYINNQAEGIEAYIAGSTSKFVTMTGERISEQWSELQDRGNELSIVLDRYMQRREPQQATSYAYSGEYTQLSDEEILRLVVEHNERFGPLLAGDISAYDNDQSRADMALCAKLAFYTKDPDQIDRIYRNSGLGRTDGKWDRQQSGSTYGRLTIDKALALVTEQYVVKTDHVRADSAEDPSRLDDRISRAQAQAAHQASQPLQNLQQEVGR